MQYVDGEAPDQVAVLQNQDDPAARLTGAGGRQHCAGALGEGAPWRDQAHLRHARQEGGSAQRVAIDQAAFRVFYSVWGFPDYIIIRVSSWAGEGLVMALPLGGVACSHRVGLPSTPPCSRE